MLILSVTSVKLWFNYSYNSLQLISCFILIDFLSVISQAWNMHVDRYLVCYISKATPTRWIHITILIISGFTLMGLLKGSSSNPQGKSTFISQNRSSSSFVSHSFPTGDWITCMLIIWSCVLATSFRCLPYQVLVRDVPTNVCNG